MAVRNSEELGEVLFKIVQRLLANEDLCKLLYYTGLKPLEKPKIENPADELLHKNVLIVPLVDEDDFSAASKIVVGFPSASTDGNNKEFKNVTLEVLVYTPFKNWIINYSNLRPFMIMSKIEKSLSGKRVDTLGTISYSGFEVDVLTSSLSCYRMVFDIDVFN